MNLLRNPRLYRGLHSRRVRFYDPQIQRAFESVLLAVVLGNIGNSFGGRACGLARARILREKETKTGTGEKRIKIRGGRYHSFYKEYYTTQKA